MQKLKTLGSLLILLVGHGYVLQMEFFVLIKRNAELVLNFYLEKAPLVPLPTILILSTTTLLLLSYIAVLVSTMRSSMTFQKVLSFNFFVQTALYGTIFYLTPSTPSFSSLAKLSLIEVGIVMVFHFVLTLSWDKEAS